MSLTTPNKPRLHHRKMRGGHHRHNPEYLKPYFPYLPLLILVVIGLAVNALWSAQTSVLGAATNLTANELLQTTNSERSILQKNELILNTQLSSAAQAKANDMVQQNYWSHTAPDGKTPWVYLNDSRYAYESAGENLAFGFMNASQVVTGWMNSLEHRENVLNGNYQEVGFGIVHADNFQGKGETTVVVAMYAEPARDSAASNDGAGTASSAATLQPSRTVSRIQMLTAGQAPWSFAIASAATLLALVVLVYRHALAWRRVFARSEAFVLRHKLFDLAALVVVLAGVILTRSSGFIG